MFSKSHFESCGADALEIHFGDGGFESFFKPCSFFEKGGVKGLRAISDLRNVEMQLSQ